jgi:hypothetical protein
MLVNKENEKKTHKHERLLEWKRKELQQFFGNSDLYRITRARQPADNVFVLHSLTND